MSDTSRRLPAGHTVAAVKVLSDHLALTADIIVQSFVSRGADDGG